MNSMGNFTHLEIPDRVSIVKGEGGMPKVVVETDSSLAEIHLHGAHVTRFQKKGEAPLLFLSDSSDFARDKPIRGGIPIIFPWFGPSEGLPANGYARTVEWDLRETTLLPDGSVSLRFKLPRLGKFDVQYLVTVSDSLCLELVVCNSGENESSFENCLHTYFQISSIDAISITGLTGTRYMDKVTGKPCVETSTNIRIEGEVDRVYSDTPATTEIEDPGFGRKIRIEKSGSESTVVWNPWIEKSIRMPDFGDEEYLQMVCVESGNVTTNKITLASGGCTLLKVRLSSEPLLS